MDYNDLERKIKRFNPKKRKLDKLRKTEWQRYGYEDELDGKTAEDQNRDNE